MTKVEEIKKNMKLLGISKEEAEELYKIDHEDIITPEMAELEKKAKAIKRYEKSEKPRKKTSKERKVDQDKKYLLEKLIKTINNETCISTVKNETEFSFKFGKNSYTVKLIKHRPQK